MILTLLNICTKKTEFIRESIESGKQFYLDRALNIKNSFFMNFFEFSIESTEADIYEYFVETECENNFFYDNIFLMDRERGRRFFKVMAIHNALKTVKLDSKVIAKYVFQRDKLSPFALAFIENFCYNSFNEFYNSFTKYISISRRLERVVE